MNRMIHAATIHAERYDGTVDLYWIEVPDGMTNEDAAATQEWHGPFSTEQEVEENRRIALARKVGIRLGLTGHRTMLNRHERRKVAAQQRAGDRADYVGDDGHLYVAIDGHEFRADHVAFLHMTGRWPDGEIEHINGDRLDNRWANLREVKSQGESA